ncbi:dynein regulatory complex subunit 5-like [Harmonia axyridis]|uniref:dynein regulatory complex subunit 5-like n=1 Tax=Harmonia axyridis TaxID=115357 RepID=UPI001E274DFC|nr:dynein regulatory complex subunit 5-like [Harmonia axyridis]
MDVKKSKSKSKSKTSVLQLAPLDYTIDTAKLASELAQIYFKEPKCEIVNSRVPHTIKKSTYTEYEASPESLILDSEQNRKIHAENLDWNVGHPPSLADCCVVSLSRNFEKLKLLNEVPCENRTYLLEILPTDLPLEICIPLIDYEHYWKRRHNDEFGIITYITRDDWNWKCLYLERYLRKLVEFAEPQYNDEFEMNEILTLLDPYVQTLRVTQLQYWLPPVTMEKEDIPEIYPEDHIDFDPIFKKCQRIDHFELEFGMNDVGENFEWRMFNISIADCEKLGKAVLNLKLLKILRVHKSKLEDLHCQALVKGLVLNTTIIELELSHCRIGDQGALCLAKLIEVHPTLQVLNLCDNLVGGIGGEGIGFALLQENSCPLVSLDLRLNPLGHQGALGLMRSLVRGNKPERLNLACCQFEDMTSYIFGCMLKVNRSLTWIDVSNNWFGDFGGENLVIGLSTNESVKWLDVRETYITPEQLTAVKHLLKRNNQEEESEEEEEEEIAVVQEVKPSVTFVDPEKKDDEETNVSEQTND